MMTGLVKGNGENERISDFGLLIEDF